jgi:hypothetical protein
MSARRAYGVGESQDKIVLEVRDDGWDDWMMDGFCPT